MSNIKVLITGATGFVGRELIKELTNKYKLLVCSRKKINLSRASCSIYIDSIDENTLWDGFLDEVDVVVHLAGYAHQSKDIDTKALYSINVGGTKQLAKKSVEAGVKRFIFVSSVKAVTDTTQSHKVVSISTEEKPEDDYGRSKLQAERELIDVCEASDMEYVIIRPVLVIGYENKGNLLSLEKCIKRNIPLPTGHINNARSVISLGNLIRLLDNCIVNPHARNSVFIAANTDPVSTFELVNILAARIGKKAIQFPVPCTVLKFFGKCFGKNEQIRRLCGNLVVDNSETIAKIGWQPEDDLKP